MNCFYFDFYFVIENFIFLVSERKFYLLTYLLTDLLTDLLTY